MSGRFITFEGVDGAGKSSQIAGLAARLQAAGACVVCTREPGGTPLAEAVRDLVLRRPMDATTETLLMFAARRDHVRELIAPALARGDTVLCDRFTDSTFAYQGGGHGADGRFLAALETAVHEGLQPDLTFWFDLPAEVAAQRRARARQADRFEAQDLEFFQRVGAAYRARSDAAPQRFARIDAAHEPKAVWRQIEAALEARSW